MRVSGSDFIRTAKSLLFPKKTRRPLLICKIVAALFFVLFSGNAVFAGAYSNCSYDELITLRNKLKNDGENYKRQAQQYDNLANTYRNKDDLTSTMAYSKYKITSSNYSSLAAQSYSQLQEVEKELFQRGYNTGNTDNPDDNVRITGIAVSVSQSSVKLNSSVNCSCRVYYSNGRVATVSPPWSVSKSSYGYFSGDTFYPLSAGVGKKVTVRAFYGGYSDSKTISISNKVKFVSLSISGSSSVPYCSAKSYTCKAKYSDNTTKAVTAKWSVNNTKYGSFSGSKFTAKAAGAGKTVTITASFDGKKVSKKITLKQRVLSSLSIKGASSVKVGAKTTLSCSAKFTTGPGATVKPTWSSSNTKVATVSSSGVVTGKKAGSATITAKYKENGVTKSATKKITVKQITGLSVSGSSNVNVKGKITLSAKAKYSDGSTVAVKPTWSSSNPKVATVSASGEVTGKLGGTVTITAKFKESGTTKTASKKITVVKKQVEITISGASSLRMGNSTTMTCYLKYDDGTQAKVTPSWSLSGGPSILGVQYAVINADGLLFCNLGRPTDSFTVTVKASYQGYSASKDVLFTTSSGLTISGPDSLKYLGSGSYYLYQDGQKVTSTSVSWSCGSLCTISDQGCYGLLKVTTQLVSSPKTTVTVTAKYNDKTVTKKVLITR